MVKIQETTALQKFIYIPRSIAFALNWKRGDVISWNFHSKSAVLIRKEEKPSAEAKEEAAKN